MSRRSFVMLLGVVSHSHSLQIQAAHLWPASVSVSRAAVSKADRLPCAHKQKAFSTSATVFHVLEVANLCQILSRHTLT